MNTETLLRDVLAEDARVAPEANGLARGARRRLRRRRAGTAGTALVLAAAVAGTAALLVPDTGRTTVTATGDRPLTGTTWRLVEYTRAELSYDVMVDSDTSLSISPAGHYAAHVCNHYGGTARVDGGRLTLGSGFNTERQCPAPLSDAERLFASFLGRELAWDVDGETLRLSGPDGNAFLFRVRPTIYDDPYAATVVEGTYEGWQYRVSYLGPSHLGLEVRPGPGVGWAVATLGYDARHPMSWALRTPIGGGGTQVVAGWAPPGTARATHETPDGTVTVLTLVDVEGRTAFHGFVARNPQHSRFRVWAADGTLIAEFQENRAE